MNFVIDNSSHSRVVGFITGQTILALILSLLICSVKLYELQVRLFDVCKVEHIAALAYLFS